MQTAVLPVISAIAAGVLIVGQMALMFAVTRLRRSVKAPLGDGSDPALQAAIRRHGNYAENAAIFVTSLALLEMLGAARPLVIGLATTFIVGRIAHAIGLSQPKTVNGWRVAGVFATIVAGVVLGVRLVTFALPHLG